MRLTGTYPYRGQGRFLSIFLPQSGLSTRRSKRSQIYQTCDRSIVRWQLLGEGWQACGTSYSVREIWLANLCCLGQFLCCLSPWIHGQHIVLSVHWVHDHTFVPQHAQDSHVWWWDRKAQSRSSYFKAWCRSWKNCVIRTDIGTMRSFIWARIDHLYGLTKCCKCPTRNGCSVWTIKVRHLCTMWEGGAGETEAARPCKEE